MLLATGCLAARALDGGAIRELLKQLGLSGVVLVTHAGAEPSRLADLPVRAVRGTLAEAGVAVAVARAAKASLLILEPSAGDELEQLAPRLHAFRRAHPGLDVALQAAAEGPFSDPETIGLLLDDLVAQNVAYWHRPARVAALGGDEVRWLDVLGRPLIGASLDDVVGGDEGLPPGLGEVDFARSARLLGRSPELAIDTEPLPEPALLSAALAHLRASGFP